MGGVGSKLGPPSPPRSPESLIVMFRGADGCIEGGVMCIADSWLQNSTHLCLFVLCWKDFDILLWFNHVKHIVHIFGNCAFHCMDIITCTLYAMFNLHFAMCGMPCAMCCIQCAVWHVPACAMSSVQ